MNNAAAFQAGIMADAEKHSVNGKEVLHDSDLISGSSREQPTHLNRLTDEELVLEKKLKRKIDSVIMPMVVLVC